MYSVGSRFKSQPSQQISWLRFILVFINPSRSLKTITEIVTRVGHDRHDHILRNTLQLFNHPTIGHYIASILKAQLNSLRKNVWNLVGLLCSILSLFLFTSWYTFLLFWVRSKHPKWCLQFRFSDENFVHISYFSHAYNILRLSHPLQLDNHNSTFHWRVHIMKALFAELSTPSSQ